MNALRPRKHIPAPDAGTNGEAMAWIFVTYSMNKGHSVLGVVTGKPLTIGGSLGRQEATARGATFCPESALHEKGRSMQGLPWTVQGFGKIGASFPKVIAGQGATVVALSA